ncbi:hypothetical protein JTB14_027587 [Gonioctena quinquepunctata]|nr:hypothetical protein JTB14_027587 [Gonioctena quinquepunctata]
MMQRLGCGRFFRTASSSFIRVASILTVTQYPISWIDIGIFNHHITKYSRMMTMLSSRNAEFSCAIPEMSEQSRLPPLPSLTTKDGAHIARGCILSYGGVAHPDSLLNLTSSLTASVLCKNFQSAFIRRNAEPH